MITNKTENELPRNMSLVPEKHFIDQHSSHILKDALQDTSAEDDLRRKEGNPNTIRRHESINTKYFELYSKI